MIADFERTPQMRASDADRDAAAERIRVAAGEGRLDPEELDERLSSVYRARWCSELVGLTSDVTPPAARVVAPVFVQRRPAKVNVLAVASLVSGMLWFWWLGSIAAIALGYVSLRQIAASQGTQMGRRLAYVGIALGFLGLLMLLGAAGFWFNGGNWD